MRAAGGRAKPGTADARTSVSGTPGGPTTPLAGYGELMTGPPYRKQVAIWVTGIVLGLVIGWLTIGGAAGIVVGIGLGLAFGIAFSRTGGRSGQK